ncbi:hypothetical protein KSP40_PGU011537 [Platanthera guangdongensis]|uniref:Uncharacterized protein n=1 Tax=Platanthera guangdongensis TaxID=2320717 RepID=A0ABR2MLK0_9ASPA
MAALVSLGTLDSHHQRVGDRRLIAFDGGCHTGRKRRTPRAARKSATGRVGEAMLWPGCLRRMSGTAKDGGATRQAADMKLVVGLPNAVGAAVARASTGDGSIVEYGKGAGCGVGLREDDEDLEIEGVSFSSVVRTRPRAMPQMTSHRPESKVRPHPHPRDLTLGYYNIPSSRGGIGRASLGELKSDLDTLVGENLITLLLAEEMSRLRTTRLTSTPLPEGRFWRWLLARIRMDSMTPTTTIFLAIDGVGIRALPEGVRIGKVEPSRGNQKPLPLEAEFIKVLEDHEDVEDPETPKDKETAKDHETHFNYERDCMVTKECSEAVGQHAESANQLAEAKAKLAEFAGRLVVAEEELAELRLAEAARDVVEYRQMRRKEQDRLTRMDVDYQKRKELAEFNVRREERLKAAEQQTAKKRAKRQKKKQKRKEKKKRTDIGEVDHHQDVASSGSEDSDDHDQDEES